MADRLSDLEEAIDAVRKAGLDPDGPGGAAALAFLLGGGEPGAAPPGSTVPPSEASSDGSAAREPASRMSRWLGAEADRIEDVIEFGEEESALRIPAAQLPRSRADRQRILALLKLAADRIAYDVDQVPAARIGSVCDDYGSLDQNLAQNLAGRGDLITRRGKRGGYVYRATQPGLERARQLLAAVLEGEERVRL